MRPCLACAIGPYRLDASSPCEMRVHVCRCPLVLSIHFYTFLYTYLSLYNTVMSIYTILSSTLCRTQSSTPSLHSVYVYSVYTQSSCVYTCVYNMCRVAVQRWSGKLACLYIFRFSQANVMSYFPQKVGKCQTKCHKMFRRGVAAQVANVKKNQKCLPS